MENIFKLEFFYRKKKNIQEGLASKECLLICKKNYDHKLSRHNLREAEKFEKFYDNLAKFGNFPSIKKSKKNN
ncbi:MAG: hypothetical protein ABIE43_03075 [Patescibacteria group bacterium]